MCGCVILSANTVNSVPRALLKYKENWNSFYNFSITKGVMDLIGQHHHQLLLPRDAIQVVQTNFRFLASLIELVSMLSCLLLSNCQVVNDGSLPDDRDYDKLVALHDSDGFPLDRSSCEPVDTKALSEAQIMQQVDEYYTR